MLTILQQIIFK